MLGAASTGCTCRDALVTNVPPGEDALEARKTPHRTRRRRTERDDVHTLYRRYRSRSGPIVRERRDSATAGTYASSDRLVVLAENTEQVGVGMSQQHGNATDDAHRGNDQGRGNEQRSQQDDDVEGATEWFATTAVRTGLTLIGVVVLLFALGQAVGLPLLELFTDALTSQTGQWLAVAFLAVLLIGAAQKVNPTG